MKTSEQSAKLLTAALAVALAWPVAPAAYADPPPWAPAHGWRKKHDPYYLGYTGKKWPQSYGVINGRCDSAAVGAVLGGTVGGVLGSQVGKGDGRTVAIILGTVLGAAVGARMGRDMDQADRGCIGHALELAPDHRRVTWTNPNTGAYYLLTPVRSVTLNGQACREFVGKVKADGREQRLRGTACRSDEGVWRMI